MSQITENRMHSATYTADAGRCAALDSNFVDRYNTVRLHSAIGYERRRICGGQQAESMRPAIASWKRLAGSTSSSAAGNALDVCAVPPCRYNNFAR